MTECVGNLKHHCISINGCVLPHLRAIFFFFGGGGGGGGKKAKKDQKNRGEKRKLA